MPEKVRASACTSSVLPRPGTPSTSTWPPASSAHSTWSMTSGWPMSALADLGAHRGGDLGRLDELLGSGLCSSFAPFSSALWMRCACWAMRMKSAPRMAPAGAHEACRFLSRDAGDRGREPRDRARPAGAAAKSGCARAMRRSAASRAATTRRERRPLRPVVAAARAQVVEQAAPRRAARRAPPARSAARCSTARARGAGRSRGERGRCVLLEEAPQRQRARRRQYTDELASRA